MPTPNIESQSKEERLFPQPSHHLFQLEIVSLFFFFFLFLKDKIKYLHICKPKKIQTNLNEKGIFKKLKKKYKNKKK